MTSPQIVKIHDLFMTIQVSKSDSGLFRFIHDCGHPGSITLPIQGAMAMVYSILDFAGQTVRPDKLKDDSKNMNGQINVKLSASTSLLHFHVKFALKFEMTEFYE